jgi:hypothetical protein
VQQGPDGLVYVAVDGDARGFDGKPTPILRLVPVERRSAIGYSLSPAATGNTSTPTAGPSPMFLTKN